MLSYWFKLAGAGILVLLAGFLAILIFGGLWSRIGIGAAMIVVLGGLLYLAWRTDQKDKAARAGLERI